MFYDTDRFAIVAAAPATAAKNAMMSPMISFYCSRFSTFFHGYMTSTIPVKPIMIPMISNLLIGSFKMMTAMNGTMRDNEKNIHTALL